MTEFRGISELASDLWDFADEAEEAAKETPDAIDRGVRDTVYAMSATAAYYAPEDKGDLERSIEAYRRDLMSWGYGTDLEYGPPIEYGSGIHGPKGEPYPIEGDPLVFEGENGETVFTDKVMHPGVEPQPFIRNSFNQHKSELEENINDELDAVFEAAFS